ncbi:MAG TPA: hypothetical protein VK921_09890 [Anditalea sp.]|nr:hypothetical protein [Anditalea sp.]
MKTFLRVHFVVFLLILTFESRAQKYPNSVYGEILGNGLFYSINYERNIMAKGKVFLSPSVGFTSVGREATGIPVMMLAYFGGPNSALETGLGYSGFYREQSFSNFGVRDIRTFFEHYATGRLGYRYESPKGFLFKVAFTPLYRFKSTYPYHEIYAPDGPDPRFWPSGGIGIGKSF